MKRKEPIPDEPLLTRLRDLRRDELDDVTASRTLARAEAAFDAAAHVLPTRRLARSPRLVPTALALWAALYVWAAFGELRRLYPSAGARGASAQERSRALLLQERELANVATRGNPRDGAASYFVALRERR